MVRDDVTSIRVYRDTKERIESQGRMSESFDDVLNRLLDERAEYEALVKRAEIETDDDPTAVTDGDVREIIDRRLSGD